MRPLLGALEARFEEHSKLQKLLSMVTIIIGPGILLMPAFMMEHGLLIGFLLLFLCALLLHYCLLSLAKHALEAGVYSYQGLAQYAYGRRMRLGINIVFILGNTGTTIITLKLMSTLILNFILSNYADPLASFWAQPDYPQQIITGIIALFILVLSSTKILRKHRYLHLASFSFIIFLCFVTTLEAYLFGSLKEGFIDILLSGSGSVALNFPTAIFTLFNPCIFNLSREAGLFTTLRFRRILYSAMVIVIICCVIVGGFGYATVAGFPVQYIFETPLVAGVILNAYSYDQNNNFIVAPALIRMCMILMTFVLLISALISISMATNATRDFYFSRRLGEFYSFRRRIFINFSMRFIIIGAATGIAIVPWTNIQAAMNIIGSSFYVILCFVFPNLLNLRSYTLLGAYNSKVTNGLILIVMSVLGIWGTISNIMTF